MLAASAVGTAALSRARAEDMDLALSRLSTSDLTGNPEDGCKATLSNAGEDFQLTYGSGASTRQVLRPDNVRFRQLVTQLGPAVAPAVLAPVTTSGPAGFDVAFETTVVGVDSSAAYWRKGSRGHGSPETCDGENRFVSPVLASNRVHFSKGLPLGITLGGTIGKLYNTSLWIVGVDLKLAAVEGLRSWAVPDAAVRAAVNTVLGDSQYSLTMFALDGILSKNLVAGRVVTISPYLGAGLLWTFATSEIVDLTPNINAVDCAAGTDEVCNQEHNGRALGASTADIGHDQPFKDTSFLRYRGFVGFQLRYRLFALSSEFMFDLAKPHAADQSAGRGTPGQWSFNVAPSLTF